MKNYVKGLVAALVIACFTLNVQAQSKMATKADTSKMAKRKMDKMKMKKEKMKMKKDTMSKM